MENGFSSRLGLVGMFLSISSLILSGTSSLAAVEFKNTHKSDRVPGEIIFKMKQSEGMRSLFSVSGLSKILGAKKVKSVNSLIHDARFGKITLNSDADFKSALAALNADSSVEYAEPNFIYTIQEAGKPDDTDYTKLWGIYNTGQEDKSGQKGTPGSDVHAQPLWALGFTGSKKVVVAIIDTGVNWDHPDLKDNLYTNEGEAGDKANNGVDDDENGYIDDVHGFNFITNKGNSSDDHGHGSHCAGTIGGRGNNALGVAGVNWEVSIMPVKFLSAQGSGTTEDAIESVKYATKMKVNVMSNSWGGGGFSQALMDAIKDAKDAGILFVAAAGNSTADNDSTPSYPASYELDNILAVAATDNLDKIATFSNYGKTTVHVAAPGVRIYSTVLKDGYDTYSGTSMATPHVAGGAALLLSTDNSLTYADLKERLIKSSDPIKSLRSKSVSGGRVNFFNAYKKEYPVHNEPDPKAWLTEKLVVESKHPYEPSKMYEFPVEKKDSKYLRVEFEKIDVEKGYDFIEIVDADGAVVEHITGKFEKYVTDYVEGSKLTIRLVTDNIVNKEGFTTSGLDYISAE